MIGRRVAITSTVSLGFSSIAGCLDTLLGEIGGDGGAGGSNGQSREVVTRYDNALATRNDATTTRDEGVTAFNERNYSDAVDPLETALSGYEDAEDGFVEAADLANEIEEETPADLCETAVDETALQADATDAALSAARAARDNADAETINGHIERFRSLREDAPAIDVADADAVASALGLD